MSVSSSSELRVNGGQSFLASKTYTGDVRDSQSFTVATSQTDERRTVAIDVSELQLFVMISDNDCTVEWNDINGTQGSVNLKANVPWIERVAADQYQTTKFAVDVTDFYITTTGNACVINIEIIKNNTP